MSNAIEHYGRRGASRRELAVKRRRMNITVILIGFVVYVVGVWVLGGIIKAIAARDTSFNSVALFIYAVGIALVVVVAICAAIIAHISHRYDVAIAKLAPKEVTY